MPERAAELFWIGLATYAAVGAFVLVFLWSGVLARFDKAAAAAPWRVRLVLAPGMIALWPLMLARAAGRRPQEDRG
jgi:hypothetical protein